MTRALPASSSLLLVAFALSLVACASIPPPKEQMAVSRSALDQARSAGAPQLAPPEFNEAQRKLELATLAYQQKKYEAARRLAEEAEADAKLAQAKAGATRSEQAANQIQRDIKVLQEELGRKLDNGG